MDELRQKLSLLSDFIKRKIKEKGFSIKEFADASDLAERYVYRLLSEKRDFTPTDETLGKIVKVLELSDTDKSYMMGIVEGERETGNIIYPDSESSPPSDPSSEVPPAQPQEPHPNPSPPSDQPGHDSSPSPQPNDTTPLPSPSDPPAQPPLPVPPQPPEQLSWFQKNKTLVIVAGVVLLGGGLVSCCIVAFVLKHFWMFF